MTADGSRGRGAGPGRVDLRVNTIPTLYGEDVAIRLLNCSAQVMTVEQIGMIRKELNELLAMLNIPSGLILVSGPTGSGKTTTLYACLKYLNNGQRKINTIEDPIEYAIVGMRQSQINPKMEVGFPELLRSVLRQAPDVIMIGEIRDPITAETAVRAANSGHLVLASLHAPSAVGADAEHDQPGRPSSLPFQLAAGSDRPAAGSDPLPQVQGPLRRSETPQTFDEVRPWLEPGEGRTLFGAQGCAECYQTGYSGRTGVFEVLRMTRELRRLIAEGRPTREFRQKAVQEGLLELRRAALLKVARGETNAEEVLEDNSLRRPRP